MAKCMLHNEELIRGKCRTCIAEAVSPQLIDSRIHHRFVVGSLFELYRCPNNGRVIDALKGDDKVLCSCGKPNANSTWETRFYMQGLHLTRLLERATEDEFWQQRQRERKEKEDQKA